MDSSEKAAVATNRMITGAEPVFGASHWKYIFKLLGLMIVADGKVVKEQVDAYLDSVIELAVVIDPKIVITRKMALDWFILNKADLVAIVHGLEYDSALLDIFQHIRSLPHKLDVITCMVKVAIADDRYDDMEKMFIKKSILYWNVHDDSGLERRLGRRTARKFEIV